MVDEVRISAHAKMNIILRILEREESGFHNLQTIFALLELHDDVTVERTDRGIQVVVSGADTGPEKRNLAYRAAEMIISKTRKPAGVRIELTKAIPVKAGLGGGSSDGAAVLHAVNFLARNPVPQAEIIRMAALLGSDVPFFASREAFAAGSGRGDRIAAIKGPVGAPALIVKPDLGISTREAYEALSAARKTAGAPSMPMQIPDKLEDWSRISEISTNDFEPVLFGTMPPLRDLFDTLEDGTPVLTRLCGSGSAIIAIYRTVADRDSAAKKFAGAEVVIPTAIRSMPAPGPVPA